MQGMQKTPLYQQHVDLGAKMVEFGGWLMPVQYTGIIEEHRAVRKAAGLFDVSHMGEIEITGPGALALVQAITTNDASRLVDGQIQYSLMCYPSGGVVDDILVYRFAKERYWLVVNAANTEKDVSWVLEAWQQGPKGEAPVHVSDISEQTGQLALQGPKSADILGRLAGTGVRGLGYYHFLETKINGIPAVVSRTGYTGEDGFEIYVPAGQTAALWNNILEAGEPWGLLPAGLGARDTLRLEARLPLYGHELDEQTTPLEAGLGIFVKLEKDPFIGREALLRQRELGPQRKLAGFMMSERGIPRAGYELGKEGRTIGKVTSGSYSPSLDSNIGLGYVQAQEAVVGNEIEVMVRGKALKAKIVKTPFYKRED